MRTKKFAKVMNDENKLHLNSAVFFINTTYNRSNSQKLMQILKGLGSIRVFYSLEAQRRAVEEVEE